MFPSTPGYCHEEPRNEIEQLKEGKRGLRSGQTDIELLVKENAAMLMKLLHQRSNRRDNVDAENVDDAVVSTLSTDT